MSKNVLIISSTLRQNGNSEILAQEFAHGAKDAGHNMEFISLRDKEIKFCRGCLACVKTQKCTIKDDSCEIVEKMKNADVIAFATPIYYYEMSGQLKTLLDRANPLFSSDYKFRDIYFLTSAADTEKNAADGAINGINGWIVCFEKAKLKTTLHAGGVETPGSIKEQPDLLKKAYDTGKNV